ncbi:prolipoprotein diacylglyceryl transferase family protein [Zhouia sp. PK063]|uniref:prolipoprotein diacylglyceryl transferase family protein n=1 Tax=Zhouia sp. PK063 TaxID=3373602 RepID=UPI0037B4AB9C
MNIPFEPHIFGFTINIHMVMEYLAFFIGYRYYKFIRKNSSDSISSKNRLSIILGAIIGGYIGSRFVGFLENPDILINVKSIVHILNAKTIMGGLFGGLLGVEIAKRKIKETHSSGDLFTFPIIIGIFIGRIGCFLSGTNEFTYGSQTTFFTGMNLGDGILRHPLALYELVFLAVLFIILRLIQFKNIHLENGLIFKYFMISYFGFRFLIEFLKPNVFFIGSLSSIQWVCIVCWLYYLKTLIKLFLYANKKIYILRLHYKSLP